MLYGQSLKTLFTFKLFLLDFASLNEKLLSTHIFPKYDSACFCWTPSICKTHCNCNKLLKTSELMTIYWNTSINKFWSSSDIRRYPKSPHIQIKNILTQCHSYKMMMIRDFGCYDMYFSPWSDINGLYLFATAQS